MSEEEIKNVTGLLFIILVAMFFSYFMGQTYGELNAYKHFEETGAYKAQAKQGESGERKQ